MAAQSALLSSLYAYFPILHTHFDSFLSSSFPAHEDIGYLLLIRDTVKAESAPDMDKKMTCP